MEDFYDNEGKCIGTIDDMGVLETEMSHEDERKFLAWHDESGIEGVSLYGIANIFPKSIDKFLDWAKTNGVKLEKWRRIGL